MRVRHGLHRIDARVGSKAECSARRLDACFAPISGHRRKPSRHESPALPSSLLLRQQFIIQFAPRWRWVWLQLNARHTHVAAIQCRISDPLPQLLVMAQGATNFQPKVPCVCINKTWRDSTISTMTMNERHIVLTHFPCLLDDFF